MDPVLKSFLTSALKDALTGLGGILVTYGYLAKDSEIAFVNDIVGIVLVLVSQGVSYYKSRQVTPAAAIATVNSPATPGLKVVDVTSPSPQVFKPLSEYTGVKS